ncbi:hypothetical protein ACFYKX_26455 [Cytobacillus sp. FJAT-54145]|uniref:Uncharacterized protein n=1 Tax=Cytobacillus spartinae TaxID=3299023 RepID=A0ABW6KIM9_9BACI
MDIQQVRGNINFEHDGRHDVTEKVIKTVVKTGYAQDDFGMKKYNTTLHHALPYDWQEMMDEEIVDFLKYHQCEKDRKAYVIQILQSAMRVDEPKEYIQEALNLLTVSGTGK